MILLHYTVNTGHVRRSRSADVPRSASTRIRHLLQRGAHVLPEPFQAFRLVVPGVQCGLVATVYHGSLPLITCGVADEEGASEVVWQELERLYLRLTDSGPLAGANFQAPVCPGELPWVVVVLLGPVVGYDWLGDFEQCLAWAWLREVQRGESK
jgi:hypothetical protein